MNEYTHTESERERKNIMAIIFVILMISWWWWWWCSQAWSDEEKKNSGPEFDVAVVGWLVGSNPFFSLFSRFDSSILYCVCVCFIQIH